MYKERIQRIFKKNLIIKITLIILNSFFFGITSFLILNKLKKNEIFNIKDAFVILILLEYIFNTLFFYKFRNVFVSNNIYEVILFLFIIGFLILM
jgi:hypothetical protein